MVAPVACPCAGRRADEGEERVAAMRLAKTRTPLEFVFGLSLSPETLMPKWLDALGPFLDRFRRFDIVFENFGSFSDYFRTVFWVMLDRFRVFRTILGFFFGPVWMLSDGICTWMLLDAFRSDTFFLESYCSCSQNAPQHPT